MKKFAGFPILFVLLVSCSTAVPFTGGEDQLMITRKYVGDFVESTYSAPSKASEPHLIWITTTLESTYGKIAAYSKSCDFNKGERLYIRRILSDNGSVWGEWQYQIESDRDNIKYILSQPQKMNNKVISSWF
ncbi:MAG: hypothetical protein GYA71_04020 [Bacteroidales bacterium]|nr:hypothetical protein [Bacteroidales bacterium]